MNKKRALWGFLVIVVIAGLFGLYSAGIFTKKDPIYITAVMNGNYAEQEQQAVNAIQMYVDKINDEDDGFNGHTVKVEFEWVKGTQAEIEAAAEKIVQENKSMIVIGNGYSGPAITMGEIFEANQIPAITAGAGTPSVTEGKDWFFRIINDNTSQGKFIAEYVTAILGYEKAAIIYDNNDYGRSLASVFEDTFTEQQGMVIESNAIDAGTENLDEAINTIISNYTEKPDVIFLAAYRATSAAAIIQIRELYPNLPIIGSSETASASFAAQVAERLNRTSTGGIVDGVYAASPLIFDVASEDAQLFSEAYNERFNEKPRWYAATSYDSALVALEAMKAAGVSGEAAQLKQDRQLLRNQLESTDRLEKGFPGITGRIFFNENHNLEQPMAIGVFENDQFISAVTQLYSVATGELPYDYLKQLRDGDLFRISERFFGRTRIVYVGIDINEFSELDIEGDHTYLADFYLWFRYEGEKINFEDVSFDNSVDPVDLGSPIEDKEIGNRHYTLFRIRETFRNSFDLGDYPFDHQKLAIKLRHNTLERKDLIFVTDILGIGDINREKVLDNLINKARAFETISDWFPVTGLFFADSIHDFSTRGDPDYFDKKSDIEHSRFNVEIEIERDYLRFLSKTMLPILAILVLSYLALFLPDREFETITSIMTGTVLSVIFFHVGLSGRLNVGYSVAIDYVFYAIYALLAIETFLSIVAWRKISKNNVDMSVKYLFWFMRALYPIVFTVVIAYTIITYNLIPTV